MSKDSPIAALTISVAVTTIKTCNSCLLSDKSETRSLYLELPVDRSVQLALSKHLETSEGEDFCICCREITPNSVQKLLAEVNTYLIVQQKRFCKGEGTAEKNCCLVECFPQVLQLPVGRNEDTKEVVPYELISMINHEGSLASGHYWSFNKDLVSGKWFSCNDRSIIPLEDLSRKLNNTFSYILFYQRT